MRILQVSSARNLGGGETHVLELSEALRSRGHEVIIAGRRNGPLHPDIKLPFLNSADLFTIFKLRRILKRRSFDILHAHVARDYSLVTAAAWKIPGVKIVLTRHLLYPVRPHALYRRVNGWVAITSQVLKTLDPLAPKLSAVIPNWVSVRKFAYRPHPLHDPITLGLLGQISPHKGHDDAIAMMQELGQAYRLIIAGRGESGYVAALKRKSESLPIEFAGFVSLPDFFDKVDILLVPSWEEPFGIVLLEAMAAGVPVIATNRGGPLDILTTRLYGLLVPPRNPKLLAEAVRELSQDEDLRRTIVREARNHVEKTYDISRVVPLIEDFYRKVIFGSA
jgi:glycosyltransferase involved in cell wall biosynthesis